MMKITVWYTLYCLHGNEVHVCCESLCSFCNNGIVSPHFAIWMNNAQGNKWKSINKKINNGA